MWRELRYSVLAWHTRAFINVHNGRGQRSVGVPGVEFLRRLCFRCRILYNTNYSLQMGYKLKLRISSKNKERII